MQSSNFRFRRSCVLCFFLEEFHYFAVFRESSQGCFRKDKLPVEFDFEDSSRRFNQFGLVRELIFQFSCQTDSSGFVSSSTAIGDFHLRGCRCAHLGILLMCFRLSSVHERVGVDSPSNTFRGFRNEKPLQG